MGREIWGGGYGEGNMGRGYGEGDNLNFYSCKLHDVFENLRSRKIGNKSTAIAPMGLPHL